MRSSALPNLPKKKEQCVADWKLTEETGVELPVADKQTAKDGNSLQPEITAVTQQQHQPCPAQVTATSGGEASAERSPSSMHQGITLYHQPVKGVRTIIEIN